MLSFPNFNVCNLKIDLPSETSSCGQIALLFTWTILREADCAALAATQIFRDFGSTRSYSYIAGHVQFSTYL
jgi:hypothetical protein